MLTEKYKPAVVTFCISYVCSPPANSSHRHFLHTDMSSVRVLELEPRQISMTGFCVNNNYSGGSSSDFYLKAANIPSPPLSVRVFMFSAYSEPWRGRWDWDYVCHDSVRPIDLYNFSSNKFTAKNDHSVTQHQYPLLCYQTVWKTSGFAMYSCNLKLM